MKKILLILCVFWMMIGTANAFQPSEWMEHSKPKTASAAIATVPGYIYGIWVATDGTNAVTFTIYDAATATGTAIFPSFVVPSSSSNRNTTISFDPPVPYNTGLYVTGSSSGTYSYDVFYRRK